MAKLIKFAILMFISISLFATGYFYYAFKNWYTLPVRVCIRNESGQSLKSLTLKFSSQISGTLDIPPPQNGKKIEVKYFPIGEGGFHVEATFDSGKVVNYIGGYVEAGYSVVVPISKNEAKSLSLSRDQTLRDYSCAF